MTTEPVRFPSGVKPALVPGTTTPINTVEVARQVLRDSGLTLGPDGLPERVENEAAERLLQRASRYIDRDGNLIALPKPAIACFGLPRFAARRKKCNQCKVFNDCRSVQAARVVFGGREQFKVCVEEPFNPEAVSVLAAISLLKGWETQRNTLRSDRRRLSASERTRRYRERHGIDEEMARRRAQREAEAEALEVRRQEAFVAAKSEFEIEQIALKIQQLAKRDDLRREPMLRRTLSDQIEHLPNVWIAERTASKMGHVPFSREFVGEAFKAFRRLVSGNTPETTLRNRLRTGMRVIDILRDFDVEI